MYKKLVELHSLDAYSKVSTYNNAILGKRFEVENMERSELYQNWMTGPAKMHPNDFEEFQKLFIDESARPDDFYFFAAKFEE